MLACEEMFLLLTNEEGKKESAVQYQDLVLRAALLSDLLMAGAITIETDDKDRDIIALDVEAPQHPVLAWAVDELRERGEGLLKQVINAHWLAPRDKVALHFASQGKVIIEESRWWNLIPERHHVTDPLPEEKLRQRLVDVINGRQAPITQDIVLIAALREVQGAYTILREDLEGMDKKTARARMDELRRNATADDGISAADGRLLDSIEKIIQEEQIMAAVIATTTIAASMG